MAHLDLTSFLWEKVILKGRSHLWKSELLTSIVIIDDWL